MGGTSNRGQRFLHHWRLQCGPGVAVDDLGTYKEHFIARMFLILSFGTTYLNFLDFPF